MAEADSLCDRVAIIDNGRIIARGTSESLKRSIGTDSGKEPTLEDVFIELTGETMQDKECETKQVGGAV
jgi:ABC-2 type transport system ATP-binding protein